MKIKNEVINFHIFLQNHFHIAVRISKLKRSNNFFIQQCILYLSLNISIKNSFDNLIGISHKVLLME